MKNSVPFANNMKLTQNSKSWITFAILHNVAFKGLTQKKTFTCEALNVATAGNRDFFPKMCKYSRCPVIRTYEKTS